MLYDDNVAQMGKTNVDLETQLGHLRQALEPNGLPGGIRVYNFPVGDESGEEALLSSQPLKKVLEFIYLGSVFQSNDDIDIRVTHQIKAGWAK